MGTCTRWGGRYAYVPETNRAVAVHGEGILAGLEHVYGARRVVDELRKASDAAVVPAK